MGANTSVSAHCSSSSHAYLIGKDTTKKEYKFANCDKHSVINETTVYIYSNGTRRSYINSTILDSNGAVLESNCSNVKHIIHDQKHYFTFYKNKRYRIMDGTGKTISLKAYSKMEQVDDNRLLVRLNKKYGIITLEDKTVVPFKYQLIRQVGKNLYLTKLNGYYGFIDGSHNILVKMNMTK